MADSHISDYDRGRIDARAAGQVLRADGVRSSFYTIHREPSRTTVTLRFSVHGEDDRVVQVPLTEFKQLCESWLAGEPPTDTPPGRKYLAQD
jgi:hypothetical protein